MVRNSSCNIIEITGRNGGRFFFPVANWRNWCRSLEFYRGVAFSAKVKKLLLIMAYPLIRLRAALSDEAVLQLISQQLNSELQLPEFVQDNFSAMISPTGDKAVIHFHGRGYYKIASGSSVPGVSGELALYNLLSSKTVRSFAFSSVLPLRSTTESVQFFMHYASGKYKVVSPDVVSLMEPLREFFYLTEASPMKWQTLYDPLELPEFTAQLPADFLQGVTPRGLVHRDFKPWNVKSGAKPLFYDFESVCWSGCPMEDFFNYIVDPLLRQITPGQVVNAVLKDHRKTAGDMLSKYHLPESEFMRYWCWYLLERIAFWRQHGEAEFAEHFAVMFKLTIQKIES